MNANQQQNDGPSGNKMLRTNDWSSQFPNNAIQGVHQINLKMIEQNQNPNIIESNYVWVQQHQQQRLVGTILTRTHQFALKLKIDFFFLGFSILQGLSEKRMLRRQYFQRRLERGIQIRIEKRLKKLKEKFSQRYAKYWSHRSYYINFINCELNCVGFSLSGDNCIRQCGISVMDQNRE